jgi:hypothetical protein
LHQARWAERRPPAVQRLVAATRDWSLSTPGELTMLRMRLRDEILPPDGRGPVHEDDVDRLLLAFEELASNGLRHGQAPVAVAVLTAANGWLIDVTDAATERAPTPATDRDPAHGGLGLPLVARLSAAHGWFADSARKHVWAYIAHRPR